jgi:5-methylcytosine-specific restriction enzyme A
MLNFFVNRAVEGNRCGDLSPIGEKSQAQTVNCHRTLTFFPALNDSSRFLCGDVMPQRAPWLCGCGYTIAAGSPCPCQRERKAQADRRRGTARERGYDSRWERESKAFLALPQNSRCACGCGRRADMVDHKRAHKGDMGLFWDRSNWTPKNRRCNSRKAASSEGGFGNPRHDGGSILPPRQNSPRKISHRSRTVVRDRVLL